MPKPALMNTKEKYQDLVKKIYDLWVFHGYNMTDACKKYGVDPSLLSYYRKHGFKNLSEEENKLVISEINDDLICARELKEEIRQEELIEKASKAAKTLMKGRTLKNQTIVERFDGSGQLLGREVTTTNKDMDPDRYVVMKLWERKQNEPQTEHGVVKNITFTIDKPKDLENE